MNTIKLKLNMPLQNKKAGEIITLNVDENGVIHDDYWRNRLKDAALDNCVSIVDNSSSTTSKKGEK